MPSPWARTRFATLVAVGMIVVMTGVAAGAAGDALILGQNNFAGDSATRLFATSAGGAFWMTQNGSGSGVRGESISGTGGVFETKANNRQGLLAQNNSSTNGSGAALTAQGNLNVGIRATGRNFGIDATATSCSGFICLGATGVRGTGFGLGAGVSGAGFVGLNGTDTSGSGFGLFSSGDASIDGDLNVTGTCTGCSAAVLGVNDSSASLNQGDAVTVTGVTTDSSGGVMLKVAAAQTGDTVIGVVDVAMAQLEKQIAGDSVETYFKPDGTSAAPAGILRVITSGIVTFAGADASGGAIAAGDSLEASDASGKLAKAAAEAAHGKSLGYALGALEDGRVAVFIAPH